MAIAFDAVGGGGAATASPWTITWSHTAAGGADCVVLISFASTPTLANAAQNRASWAPVVTYGSQTAMFVGYTNTGTTDNTGGVETYAVWNPPTGAQTVSVAVSGASQIIHGNSVSYTGVGGVRRSYHSSGNSTAPSVTVPSVSGRYYHHVATDLNSTFSAYSQTQRYRDATTDQVVIGDAAGTGANLTFSYTSASGQWCNLVTELFPTTETGICGIRSVGLGSQAVNTTGTTTLGTSASHYLDVSGSNTLAIAAVVVSVSTNNTDTTVGVNWGGTAMTLQGSLLNIGATTSRAVLALFALPNPPTGNSTVTVTIGGAGTKTLTSLSTLVLEDVQTTGLATPTTATATGITVAAAGAGVTGGAVHIVSNGATLTQTMSHDDLDRRGSTVNGVGDFHGFQYSPWDSAGSILFAVGGTSTTPGSIAMTFTYGAASASAPPPPVKYNVAIWRSNIY